MANLGSCSSQLPRKLSEGLMGKGEGRFQSQAGEVTFPSELCVVTQPHHVLVCVSGGILERFSWLLLNGST